MHSGSEGSAADRRWKWPGVTTAAIVGVLGFFLLHTEGKLLRLRWLAALLVFVPVWVLLERLNRLGYFPRCRCSPRYVARLVVLAGFMILTLFSSAVQHSMFFFVNWTAAGGVPLPPVGTGKLGVFIILTAL